MDMKQQSLYLRWVAANSFGEMVGLGLTFAIGFGVVAVFGEWQGVLGTLLTFGLMVATGAIEGSVLGITQWWAMYPWLPGLTRKTWVLATIYGALVAWFFGSLPFSLINMANPQFDPLAAPVEPPQWFTCCWRRGLVW
jgi:hypothetical protein